MTTTTTTLRAGAPWRVLDGFGRAQNTASRRLLPRDAAEVASLLHRARDERLPVTLRGAGRSYGDASLTDGGLALDLGRMNRMLDWDPRRGVADVEPGLTIEGLWRRTIEDGWWPTVVPGTMFPTIGGCVAMNIHGKNHFAVGSFGEQLLDLDLITPGGKLMRLGPSENGALFRAVVGGAGLLGVVTRVRLQLTRVDSGLLCVEPLRARSFDELMERFEARLPDADYLVAWIDCLDPRGRGLIHRANYSAGDAASLHVENQHLPGSILGIPRRHAWKLMRPFMNHPGLRAINAAKYHAARLSNSPYLQSHVGFAFLLDYVPDWRLAYGGAGLAQIQLFLPAQCARALIPRLLELCRRHNLPPYLGVLKRHRRDDFLLSHALDGYSLALDFPARAHARLHALARELTAQVIDAGGTFYLAKDSLLVAAELRRAYGDRLTRFIELKSRLDPDGLLTSDLARRLQLSAEPERNQLS